MITVLAGEILERLEHGGNMRTLAVAGCPDNGVRGCHFRAVAVELRWLECRGYVLRIEPRTWRSNAQFVKGHGWLPNGSAGSCKVAEGGSRG